MRTLSSLFTAALLLLATLASADPHGHKSRLFRIAAPTLDDPARSVRVYLPPSYDLPESSAKHYPVVYLLHGWPGSDDNWADQGKAGVTLDSLTANGEIPEVIAIMPNGHGVGLIGRSIWMNSYDGRSHMEDFVVHDLLAWTDSTWRTIPDADHRAVIGLSDGGTAAFNLLMRHRSLFSAAASLSGRFWLEKEMGMNGALIGKGDSAVAFLERNSPGARIEREKNSLMSARLYIDCGIKDHDISDNREFHAELERAGIPHEYHEYPGGHGWSYWRKHLRDALLGLIGTRLPAEHAASP